MRLSDDYYAKLQAKLEKMTGQRVVLEKKEDPQILAGVIARIGDRVYDCFLGSGTCAVAAEETKRQSICVERDEDYIRVALERMETTFGLKAELIKL